MNGRNSIRLGQFHAMAPGLLSTKVMFWAFFRARLAPTRNLKSGTLQATLHEVLRA